MGNDIGAIEFTTPGCPCFEPQGNAPVLPSLVKPLDPGLTSVFTIAAGILNQIVPPPPPPPGPCSLLRSENVLPPFPPFAEAAIVAPGLSLHTRMMIVPPAAPPPAPSGLAKKTPRSPLL